ncbi:MAG: 16S rRNA (uracil(1498)-N(3))-methyltransferase [Bacteroidales bacterium]|nr:16S rRNA (uracil(1498)-N(3))-methyltransferase [Bacteroidales bacterium]
MQVFFLPEITKGNSFLGPEESHHCSKVLRMSPGEKVLFMDGKGTLAEGEILEPSAKNCRIIINLIYCNYNTRPYHLHIAIAPTKNISRFEWFLEKSTEIGIDNITPLLCTRSERKHINIKRSKKIILSAMKQSITTVLPEINEMVSIKSFINNLNTENAFMAYCDSKDGIHLKSHIHPAQKYTILIGPEGGFCPEEVKLAKGKDIQLVSLGASRLRTETAGIAACHTISLCNEET